MTEYTIVIEDAGANYSAYVVGLDGCIASGQTVEVAEANMRDAIQFHLAGLRLHGDLIPTPMPIAKTVHIAS